MQFDPKVSFWFGVIITICIGIDAGTVSLTNVIPASAVPTVEAWSGLMAFVGSTILTAMHGFSSSAPGPLTPEPPKKP